MRPPLVYRAVLNPLRAWLEDRRAPEYGYVAQMRAWWRPERKVRPFLNLLVIRSAKRKVA